MTDPINWVRQWLLRMSLKAVMAKVAARRKTYQGIGAVDFDALRALAAKRQADQQRDMLTIQAGALWTAHSLHKAGYLPTGTCPWRGIADEDLRHLWWECPAFESCRVEVWKHLRDLPWQRLPACLALRGIPVEPAADLLGPLWRRQDGPEGADEHEGHAMDLQSDDRIAWIQVTNELAAVAAPAQPNHVADLTVRQLGQFIQGGFPDFPQWVAPRIEGCLRMTSTCILMAESIGVRIAGWPRALGGCTGPATRTPTSRRR